MKKLYFWRADWFLGVVVTLALLVFSGDGLINKALAKDHPAARCQDGEQTAKALHLFLQSLSAPGTGA